MFLSTCPCVYVGLTRFLLPNKKKVKLDLDGTCGGRNQKLPYICQCPWMRPDMCIWLSLPEELGIKHFLNIMQDCWQVLQSSNLMTRTHIHTNPHTHHKWRLLNYCAEMLWKFLVNRRWLWKSKRLIISGRKYLPYLSQGCLSVYLTFCIAIFIYIYLGVSSENKWVTLSSRILIWGISIERSQRVEARRI